MAFTVTATQSGSSAGADIFLCVRVLTNATEAGGASGGSATSTGAASQGSLTPNFSGSYVAFSISGDNFTSNMPAAATGNTYDYNSNSPGHGWSSAQGHYSGTVTAATPLTYGAGSAGSGQDHGNWCAYEVPANGTITVDGSSPAGVGNTTGGLSVTTASFTPPTGAVLVAQVTPGGTGSGTGVTVTITDTSGLSLVWTRRAISSTSDNFQPTFIFTATVGAAPPVVSVNPRTAKPSKTWLRRYQHFTRPTIQAPLQQVAAHAGVAAVSAKAQMGPKIIMGLAGGSAGHFVDQYGAPRLFYNQVVFGLPANAGRWNSGNWQSDFDQYFADIAAMGMTVAEVHPWGHSHTGCNNDAGNTWDSVSPWTTLPALNSTFWQRIDYMLNSALANGVTVLMCLTMQCDMGVDAFAGTGVFNGVSAANIQTACQNIAARYATQPNLIFFSGDDYNEDDDTRMSANTTGLAAGGYAGPMSVENYSSGTTSRRDLSGSPTGTFFTFGGAVATFNWCYYYNVTYFAVEQAYKENSQIPVVWGDGFFPGGGGGEPSDTHLLRNFVWWSLASGARGVSMGSETVLRWPSTAFADLTTNQLWFSTSALNVYNAFSGLAGWQNLLPDLTNSLVTAGRGTRAAYSSSNFQAANLGSDNYVAASVTPDKSLAVIYCAVAMSITIDQAQVVSGYTATWMDPANGATQSVTTGSTYSSSGLGNNSAGNADWVLVLQGTPPVNAGAAGNPVSVVAPAPSTVVTATAGVAAVSAAAPAPSVADTVTAAAPAVLAAVTAAVPASTAPAGVGVVLVADPGATVTTSANATAHAGVAAVSVIAPTPSVAGTAAPGAARILAVAPAPVPATAVPSGAGTVQAAAAVPVPAGGAVPGVAAAATADPGAAGSTGSGATVSATAAAVQAAAATPAIAETVNAGAAAAGAVAPDAVANTSSSTTARPAAAAVQASAPVPALTLTSSPPALPAAVAAAAPAPSPPLRPARSAPDVTDPRDGADRVTAAATSAPGVT